MPTLFPRLLRLAPVLAAGVLLAPAVSFAADSARTLSELKKLSLEELLNQEVTLVTRRPEKLAESPSAVQIVTGEDIQRSTAVTLAEALRLAPNLQVAQQNSHDWAITARGFNGAPLADNSLANKLLVMIDGRSVYTPLFGGVYWDVQQVLLEDVDRIEVVSGPGTSVWGANSVNGVVNVVSKSARETQGLYASAGEGTFLRNYGAVRYGGRAGEKLFFRVYGQRFVQDSFRHPDGTDANDDWHLSQGGVRADYFAGSRDVFTLQGDAYRGTENIPTGVRVNGQNALARWTRTFSDTSELKVQAYWDRTSRRFSPSTFSDTLTTHDLDVQHSFAPTARHQVTWGGNLRRMRDETTDSAELFFVPANRFLTLFSGFVQDEIVLVPDRWRLTVGSKFERNTYSGNELQPGARLAWTPTGRQTVWAAVSRAVRSPSRFDTDARLPLLATPPDTYDAEKLVAYEMGYRVRPTDRVQLSVATFYNHYRDLRSIDATPGGPAPFRFGNHQRGHSAGLELSGTWQPTDWWRLRAGYTLLRTHLAATAPNVLPGSDRFEATDPRHQALLHSTMDLPGNFRLDVVTRYVSPLPATPIPTPRVPAYLTADIGVTWVLRHLELTLSGRSLGDRRHPEFGGLERPRGFYAMASWRR